MLRSPLTALVALWLAGPGFLLFPLLIVYFLIGPSAVLVPALFGFALHAVATDRHERAWALTAMLGWWSVLVLVPDFVTIIGTWNADFYC